MSVSKTIVISCAGMGKRLGIGTTKALVEVDGVPLIIRHLRMLDDIDDVRVVVGYQAEKVIETVNAYRGDVTFVFNHDYMHNGTGASVKLAARYANDLILTLDGDLLIHPADMQRILDDDGEFVGVTTPGTDDPVLTQTKRGLVCGFSRDCGDFEWTGVTQIRSNRLAPGDGHVYQLIESLLPLKYRFLRTKEIDTMNDYENAVKWVRNGYSDEVTVGIVGGMGSRATLDLFRRFLDAFPMESEQEKPRIIIDNYSTMPSRVKAVIDDELHEDVVRRVALSVKNLIASGATHIVLACGTLHAFIEEVSALTPESDKYILNMIDICARSMSEQGVTKALLLASENTVRSEVYQNRFSLFGVSIAAPDKNTQSKVDRLIEAAKRNRLDSGAANELVGIIDALGENDIVLGSTELPILVNSLDTRFQEKRVYDPLQKVIDAIVSQHTLARSYRSAVVPD